MSGIYRSLSSDWLRSLRSAGHRSWQIRQPAAQSKLRELRQRARSACFVPVMAINKPDFMAGYSLFYESARYGGDFMAAIENNLDFSLSHFSLSPKYLTSDAYITKKRPAFADLLCAVGETRTRTGLLPLPPQSSVSTISPPPLCLFWDCKGTHFF